MDTTTYNNENQEGWIKEQGNLSNIIMPIIWCERGIDHLQT